VVVAILSLISSSYSAIFMLSQKLKQVDPSIRKLLLAGYQVLGYFTIFIAPNLLKRLETNCRTLEDYVDLAFSFRIFPLLTIRPLQVKEEIIQLLKLLLKIRPNVVCEIGAANGGTLFLLSKIANPNAIIISIDLPNGYPRYKIPFYKSFASQRQKIHLIQADSHDPFTIKAVKDILCDRKIDFLFVDGDHSYEGVKKDFQMYSKLVKHDGIMAFHDIVLHPPETGCEVNNFWLEVCDRYKTLEIIKDQDQEMGGMGIIFK